MGSLQRWGHSTAQQGSVLYIFGGYGGCSAHKRLNDLIAIDLSASTAYSPVITGGSCKSTHCVLVSLLTKTAHLKWRCVLLHIYWADVLLHQIGHSIRMNGNSVAMDGS